MEALEVDVVEVTLTSSKQWLKAIDRDSRVAAELQSGRLILDPPLRDANISLKSKGDVLDSKTDEVVGFWKVVGIRDMVPMKPYWSAG